MLVVLQESGDKVTVFSEVTATIYSCCYHHTGHYDHAQIISWRVIAHLLCLWKLFFLFTAFSAPNQITAEAFCRTQEKTFPHQTLLFKVQNGMTLGCTFTSIRGPRLSGVFLIASQCSWEMCEPAIPAPQASFMQLSPLVVFPTTNKI